MMRVVLIGLVCLLASGAAAPTSVSVHVQVRGVVSTNYAIFEPFDDVRPGAEARMSFLLDSRDYIESHDGTVRGYVIDPRSFDLSMGKESCPLFQSLGPDQDVYFVIEDGADGRDTFRLSLELKRMTGAPLDMHAAFAPYQQCKFQVPLPAGTLSSPELLDALGGYTNLMTDKPKWTVNDSVIEPIWVRFESMRLTPVRRPG